MSRAWRAAAAAVLLLAGLLPGAVAAAPATFGSPSASATWDTGITFTQPVDAPVALARVEILLTVPGSLGPSVTQVQGATPAGSRQLSFDWSTAAPAHLTPNTPVTARWRLVPADRSLPAEIGPAVTVLYSDTRFPWRTLQEGVVRLHWYSGDDAFARRVMAIARKGVADAEAFLGVTETEPVDFFVYADQTSMYGALGPSTRENVGAEQFSDIRSIFAWIGPDDTTADVYVPHELTHLVFNTAVQNPYHSPPRWLNEGVAVYLTEGYTTSDRSAVQDAAASQRLMPIQSLGGLFPTTTDGFYLAYAESVSAVEFLVRTYGADALVALIHNYARGVTDDEAFRGATGTDVAGFEAAWLHEVGATAPVRQGPQPAPAGPVPPGWAAAAGGPSASPGAATAGAAPASGVPAPAGTAGDASPAGQGWVIALAAAAGLLVGGGIALVRRRRAVPAAGPATIASSPGQDLADARGGFPRPDDSATTRVGVPGPDEPLPTAAAGSPPGGVPAAGEAPAADGTPGTSS